MKLRVQKWGNSLALRIPKSFATEAGLRENTPVEVSIHEGKLVIRSLAAKSSALDELLRGITDENLPDEWDTGRPIGKEVW